MSKRAFLHVLPLLLCLGVSGCSAVPIPTKSSISAIEICSGRRGCNHGEFKIKDAESISRAMDPLSPFQSGWQTDRQTVFTTGWLSYPTPEESMLFRDRNCEVALVVWIATGWIGAAVYEGASKGKYFRKACGEEVNALRIAFDITSKSERSTEETTNFQELLRDTSSAQVS